MKTKTLVSIIGLLTLFSSVISAAPLGTAFTYQGRLTDGGNLYTGNAEFQTTLWDVASGGTALATNVTGSVVVGVTNGLFVLPLDFSTNFSGDARWLQLEVRTAIGPFTTLTPRQQLTPSPYALYAPNAGTAATASSVPAANITGTLSDDRLSGNVARLNSNQTFTGINTYGNTGNSFTGNGSGLTGLNASSLASGTVPDARLSGIYSANVTFNNPLNNFAGNGGGLTSLNANNLSTGTLPDARLGGAYSSGLSFSNPGNNFTGNGSGLTSLNANNISSGTLPDARLNGIYSYGVSFNNAGNNFTGNGSGLTSLNAGNLSSGTVPSARLSGTYASAVVFNNAGNNFAGSGTGLTGLSAGNLASGTLPDGRLSGTYSSAVTLNNAGNSFTGNGAGLTSLNAGNLTSGTVADARLSANVAKLNATQTFTGDNTFQNGVSTSEGTSGSLYRISRRTIYTGSTDTNIVSFAPGRLIWDKNSKTVKFVNTTAYSIHYAGNKNEGAGGVFLSGYAAASTTTTLATLDANGEYLVLDISRPSFAGTIAFVHLYCFYDATDLNCHYYYNCE